MPTKIHQTGTRTAWTFKHDDHADTILIMPTGTSGLWYVIREYRRKPAVLAVLYIPPPAYDYAVMNAAEIFETYGFQVEAWEHPAKVI